jgi:hypothetical protein
MQSSFALRLAQAFRLKLAEINDKVKMLSQRSFNNAKDSEHNSTSKPKRKKIVSKKNSGRRVASGSINFVDDDHHVASEKGSTPRKLAENDEKDKLIPKHANQKHFGNFLRANSKKKIEKIKQTPSQTFFDKTKQTTKGMLEQLQKGVQNRLKESSTTVGVKKKNVKRMDSNVSSCSKASSEERSKGFR